MVRAGHMSDEKRNEVGAARGRVRPRKPGRLPRPRARMRTTRRPPSTRARYSRHSSAPSGVRMRRRCPTRRARSCRAARPGESVLVQGRVSDADGKPITDAILECLGMRRRRRLLRAAGSDQPESYNLRGQFRDRCRGTLRASVRCCRCVIRIPVRRAGAEICSTMLDRHPAIVRRTIHFLVRAPGLPGI